MKSPDRIYGVDFSGAKDAGKKIWIAKGVVKRNSLLIEDCFRARDLPNSGKALEICLTSLLGLIKKSPDVVFGLDFPFGLPRALVQHNRWEDFVTIFPNLYEDPEHFREKCFSVTGDRELRRKTDQKCDTPFSPYNLRIYKQTYYGISKILGPLVLDNAAYVLPMQKPIVGKSWILEICPASTLKDYDLYQKYKYRNRKDDRPEIRSIILDMIETIVPLRFQNNGIRELIIGDTHGDALDSVIAAIAIFRALKSDIMPQENWKDFWKIKGYVYV